MNLKSKIEKLRNKLHKNIERYGLASDEVRKVSLEIDELINQWNNGQQIFDEDNNMGIAYKESIEKIKQITIDFGEFPTIKEWNKYAQENVLLSSQSIEYISHLNWNQLRDKIEYEINKKIF